MSDSAASISHPQDLVYYFPFTAAPTSQYVSGATFTNRLEPPCYILDTTTPGANKLAEYGCMLHDSDDPLEIKLKRYSDEAIHFMGQINRISSFVGCYTLKSNLTNTQYIGIELGSIDTAAPLVTNPTSGGVCQVRWVAGTDSWELFTARGDGTEGVSVPLSGVTNVYDSNNVPHGAYVTLEANPFSETLRAWINGKLGAEYKGPAFPDFASLSHSNGSHQILSGIFATTGSSASGRTAAFFSAFEHRIVGFLSRLD